jgi:hypothetical protein
LGASTPEQADLTGDLDDAQAQLEMTRQLANEYGEYVTRILRQTEGRPGGEGHQEEREEKGNEIAAFLGEDRQ